MAAREAAVAAEGDEIRDQVAQLADRQIRVARHGRMSVGTDVAGRLDQNRIGIDDRLGEVRGRVVAAHPAELRPDRRAVVERKVLAGDAMARRAAEVAERPPAGDDVARGKRQLPAEGHAPLLVERVHRHTHARPQRRTVHRHGLRTSLPLEHEASREDRHQDRPDHALARPHARGTISISTRSITDCRIRPASTLSCMVAKSTPWKSDPRCRRTVTRAAVWPVSTWIGVGGATVWSKRPPLAIAVWRVSGVSVVATAARYVPSRCRLASTMSRSVGSPGESWPARAIR